MPQPSAFFSRVVVALGLAQARAEHEAGRAVLIDSREPEDVDGGISGWAPKGWPMVRAGTSTPVASGAARGQP